MAYVFGNFYINDIGMGIRLKNFDTGKIFNIVFATEKNNSLIIIPVTPGTYNFGELLFLFNDNPIYGDKPWGDPRKLESEDFQMEAEKLYYFGDWVGVTTSVYEGKNYKKSWNLAGLKDEFEDSLNNLKEKYQNLSGLDAINVCEHLELIKKNGKK